MFNQSVQIGWLDLSEAEQRRAREYLRQFRTEGTIDELGFGIVRDALADVFFPATNTIMTRTRYLFFVAGILLRIERERLSGAKAAKRLKQLEDDLRQILTRDGSGESNEVKLRGVIGASAKDDLQTYPSNIYWNALKRLGLFLRPKWSLNYYLDHLNDYYRAITPKHDDDGLSHLGVAEMHNWDPMLEEIEFLPELDFHLSPKEARYLKARFDTLAEAEGPSLLAHLLGKLHGAAFIFPWQVPCPEALRCLMNHARAFSMFTKGTTLQYYDLLVEEQRRTGLKVGVESFEKPFAEWWALTQETLAKWSVDDFFTLLDNKCRTRPNDRVFLMDWLKMCREAQDGSTLLCDTRARDLVRRRERTVRPSKHRLGQDKYLRQWKSPASLDGTDYTDPQRLPYLLDFRSAIGGVFVREIVIGLKEKA